MPFQPVPNVAQVSLHGRVDGQLTINNLYFEISGGGITIVNIGELCLACAQWAGDQLAPLLSDDWSFDRAVARDLTTAAGPQAISTYPVTGGVSGEAAPNNVAACISFQTGLAGRTNRGRNYVPGIPNEAITLNTMSNVFTAAIQAVYEQLIGPGTFVLGWQQVVVSRRIAGDLRPSGVATPVVLVGFSRPYVASMRTRAVGHGA